jgi:hypothetical protein
MTVFFVKPKEYDWLAARYNALWVLIVAINAFSLLCIFLSMNLNICLAIDLIFMIKQPFARKDDRVALYLWSSVAIAVALTVANIATFRFVKQSE